MYRSSLQLMNKHWETKDSFTNKKYIKTGFWMSHVVQGWLHHSNPFIYGDVKSYSEVRSSFRLGGSAVLKFCSKVLFVCTYIQLVSLLKVESWDRHNWKQHHKDKRITFLLLLQHKESNFNSSNSITLRKLEKLAFTMTTQKFRLLGMQSASKTTGYRMHNLVWFPFVFIAFVSVLSLGTTQGNWRKVARMWSWHSLTSTAEFKNMCGALSPFPQMPSWCDA
jgi:hypothetical protein